MKLLSKHVSGSVFGAIMLVLVVIVGLDVLSAIIDQMDKVDDEYTFGDVLAYVLLTLPGRVHEYIPFASLVGCLIGLGALASQSELIIMRSAGVSTLQVIWMVMKPALVLMLVGLLLSEFVAPVTEQLAERKRAEALQRAGGFASRHGLWNREGNEYMHFAIVDSETHLRGVSVFTFDEQRRLQRFLYASEAEYVGNAWLFDTVDITYVGDEAATEARIRGEQLDKMVWNAGLTPDLLKQLVIKPENLSLSGLWEFSNYLIEQELSAAKYKLALWSKLLQPLGTASLVLIAISFVFGPLREVTMGYRIFVGVVVGIAFRTSQDMLGPSSLVFGFAPILAVLIPIVICLSVGLLMLRRA